MKFFDREKSRIIQVEKAANPLFWDEKWSKNDVGVYSARSVAPILSFTRKYLSPSSLILEGGCGAGGKVAALSDAGFRIIGIDYASQTVARLNQFCPEYDVREGDVFSLNFPDGYFDGYWSFGVIEHFWGGYQGILKEANRVIRSHGYFFLTFPCMSPMRKLKAKFGLYKNWSRGSEEPKGFYQFMLNLTEVEAELDRNGFSVLESRLIQVASGVKQELPVVWKTSSICSRVFGVDNIFHSRFFENLFAKHSGHIAVVVAQRKE